jgi:hypothetical protein
LVYIYFKVCSLSLLMTAGICVIQWHVKCTIILLLLDLTTVCATQWMYDVNILYNRKKTSAHPDTRNHSFQFAELCSGIHGGLMPDIHISFHEEQEIELSRILKVLAFNLNVYRLLVGKSQGKRPLGRSRHRWIDSLEVDLLEIGLSVVYWISLVLDRYRWRALVNAVMNLRVP